VPKADTAGRAGAPGTPLTAGIRVAVSPADLESVHAIEEQGRDRGAVELELHAQTHALGFYERLGYVVEGPEYLDGGIPHRTMTRSLAG
jgi:hypothetical protein